VTGILEAMIYRQSSVEDNIANDAPCQEISARQVQRLWG